MLSSLSPLFSHSGISPGLNSATRDLCQLQQVTSHRCLSVHTYQMRSCQDSRLQEVLLCQRLCPPFPPPASPRKHINKWLSHTQYNNPKLGTHCQINFSFSTVSKKLIEVNFKMNLKLLPPCWSPSALP